MTLSGVENHIMQHKVAAKSEMNVVEILQKIKSTLLEIKQEIETIEEERKKKKGENKAVVFKGSGEEGDSSQEEEDDNENSPFRQLELF